MASPFPVSDDIAARLAGKYLTFRIGREEYGVPVLAVREIITLLPITPIPQVPQHLRGMINLRGKVIPVVDLACKFGMTTEFTSHTCIIVVRVGQSQSVALGMLVDAVSDVINLTADVIDGPPALGVGQSMDAVQGLAKLKGSVKILLDLDRTLASDYAAATAA